MGFKTHRKISLFRQGDFFITQNNDFNPFFCHAVDHQATENHT